MWPPAEVARARSAALSCLLAPRSRPPGLLRPQECTDGPFTEHWGAAFVSVAGHRHTRGYGRHVSLMSQSKVVAYILAIRLVRAAPSHAASYFLFSCGDGTGDGAEGAACAP